MLPAPEAELEASCKELDEKVTWLLHNSRKMDNYLELEPFSKDGRLLAAVLYQLVLRLFMDVYLSNHTFTCSMLYSPVMIAV